MGHALGSGLPPPVSPDWTAQRDVIMLLGFIFAGVGAPVIITMPHLVSEHRILTQECERALHGFRAQNGRGHDGCLLAGGGGWSFSCPPCPTW